MASDAESPSCLKQISSCNRHQPSVEHAAYGQLTGTYLLGDRVRATMIVNCKCGNFKSYQGTARSKDEFRWLRVYNLQLPSCSKPNMYGDLAQAQLIAPVQHISAQHSTAAGRAKHRIKSQHSQHSSISCLCTIAVIAQHSTAEHRRFRKCSANIMPASVHGCQQLVKSGCSFVLLLTGHA